MFEAVSTLVDEHADLERQLSQPETHADARLAKKLNQRYAELTAIVTTWREWQQTAGDIEAARELGADDPDFAAEAERMVTHREELAERLRRLLVPRDATDDKDAIVEVKSGEGGEESALFAADLARMYVRYAERHGWTVLEVPVDLRTGERTTVRLVRDTLQLLRDLWRIRHWSATGAYELPVDSGVPARV